MSDLKKVLLNEIEDFREKGKKFAAGELSIMDFKHASGGFGVYSHRGGKELMIRLRIPSGIIKKSDLKQVYEWAKRYNLDKVHLTTRQAIQYHGIQIDDVCEIMKEGLDKDIFTRGSGGNFPRNVAISPLSGVDPEEAFDVTPYAVAAGKHFLEKIYTYKLPRKLKVSFSNSQADDAHCTVQDLGFLAVNKDGKESFTVYSGGGLGRNPRKSIIVAEGVEPKDVLYHLEGMTSMFIAEGDYNNRNKARIRYILDRLGEEEYIKCYNKHVDEAKAKGGFDLNITPVICKKQGTQTSIKDARLFAQKQKGLYSVYFHPIGGQFMLEDLKNVLDVIESIEDVEMRLSMNEGIYFLNLNGDEAEKVLKITSGKGGETTAEQSVSCIGVPICQIGLLNSQCALHSFVDAIKERGLKEGSLPRVYFSGCQNSCGVHEIAEIGFTGKMKRVNDESRKVFELHVGGSIGIGSTKLGEIAGDIPEEDISNFLLEVGETVERSNMLFKEWINRESEEFKAVIEKYSV
ncbi:MAG: nitrite/sulfite reductase [Clostridium sp.]